LQPWTHDTTDTRPGDDEEADPCDLVGQGHPGTDAASFFMLTAYGRSIPAGGGQASVVSGANAANDEVQGKEESGGSEEQPPGERRVPREEEGERTT
jgi:hypothetical protein